MPRNNDGTMPENHGLPWYQKDEDLLLKKISEGETVDEISKYFKRTNGGITSRLRELACRFVEDGTTIEQASMYTRVAVEDIEKSINLRKLGAKNTSKPVLKKEDTILSVVIEIRDLLRELLNKDKSEDNDDVETLNSSNTLGLR